MINATSYVVIQLNTRWCITRLMTWQELFARPYHNGEERHARAGAHSLRHTGPHPIHFFALNFSRSSNNLLKLSHFITQRLSS